LVAETPESRPPAGSSTTVELAQLSLPPDEFPNIVESARDMADVWLSNPDRWWRDTVDLIVFGLETMLERRRERARGAPA
jgi:hypothetical protein